MLGRIKYRLLVWLIDDICKRNGPFASDCVKCALSYYVDEYEFVNHACRQVSLYKQARRVWGLEE